MNSKVQMKFSLFRMTVTKEQVKDCGMALVLVCLLSGYLGLGSRFYAMAIPLLLVNMVYPAVYRPFAKVWFALSHLLGTVTSKLLLFFVFFALITPIGRIRRLMGADILQLRKWKRDDHSVFHVRRHTFGPEDTERPY